MDEVNAKGPNYRLIAELGCELERAYNRNYFLDKENRNLRRSYKRLKDWFTRQFKYYKAHRDELLNEKNEIRNSMDSSILHTRQFTTREQEPRIRQHRESSRLVSMQS